MYLTRSRRGAVRYCCLLLLVFCFAGNKRIRRSSNEIVQTDSCATTLPVCGAARPLVREITQAEIKSLLIPTIANEFGAAIQRAYVTVEIKKKGLGDSVYTVLAFKNLLGCTLPNIFNRHVNINIKLSAAKMDPWKRAGLMRSFPARFSGIEIHQSTRRPVTKCPMFHRLHNQIQKHYSIIRDE